MTLLKIAQIGHPVLRRRAREVSRDELASAELQRFIDDLIETMRDANGAGLAAPQVHRELRICAVEVAQNPRYPYLPSIPLEVLVNPVITPLGPETFENYEGCLSVPNLRGLCDRFTAIELAAWDRHGAETRRTIRGLSAGVYQHECDHLDATLFVDRVKDPRSLTTLAEFERHHRDPFVARMKALAAREGAE